MFNEYIMQFFAYDHLPEHLQEVAQPFADMAKSIVGTLPGNPERTVALRKLLESKDAAVRAALVGESGAQTEERLSALEAVAHEPVAIPIADILSLGMG